MRFSAGAAVRAGIGRLARRRRQISGATLAVLLPFELVYGLLDADRGWRGGFDVTEVAAIAVGTVGAGLAFVAAGRAYRGDSGRQAMSWVVRRAHTTALLTVVVCGAFLVGLILLIVPGLVILTRWSLAWATYSDTDVSWRDALGRSNELVRGHSWRMFWLLTVLSALHLGVDYAVWHSVEAATSSETLAFGAAAAAGFVMLVIEAAILFAAYEQLRSGGETA